MKDKGQSIRNAWCAFALFALMLFVKCVLFHGAVFHSVAIRSLWRDPLGFCGFYISKLLMPLFIASFVFLTKRNWWACFVSVLVDLWLISNTIYYRAYGSFLSVDDLLLVSNMEGAWSSIVIFLDWFMLAYLLMTGAWCVCASKLPSRAKRQWTVYASLNIFIFFLAIFSNYHIKRPRPNAKADSVRMEQEVEWSKLINKHGGSMRVPGDPKGYLPFYDVFFAAVNVKKYASSRRVTTYVRQQSILSYFVALFVHRLFRMECSEAVAALDGEDALAISRFVRDNEHPSMPRGSLVIFLVESFESWPIDDDIEGQCIAPHLRQLTRREHVLYCSRVKNQTLAGNSGDGQMIVNTGLLPISEGAACMSYGDNVFPDIASRFQSSSLINPWPKIWNQDVMSVRYGYKKLCEPTDERWEDADVLDETLLRLKESAQPTCIMALTVSMHCPFNRIRNDRVRTHAASFMNRYLQCLNYTDSCLGAFMQKVLDDPALAQSTVVITGDHTIFKPSMLTEFKDYAVRENLSIASGENFCPLIIYSPAIEGNVQVANLCYQMDVYPTVKHLIGCANGGWNGFGVNLLDPAARRNRPIDEQEAYRLSDLMIRSDYFRRYLHQRHPGAKPGTEQLR